MRRAILVGVVALALAALAAPSAGAAVYRGAGPGGTRVSFVVKRDRIVAAKVSLVIRCTKSGKLYKRKRIRRFYGAKQANGKLVRSVTAFPLDGEGRFFLPPPGAPEEPGYWEEERFVGRVGPAKIAGYFYYEMGYQRSNRYCRSGRRPPTHRDEPRTRGVRLAHFLAKRQ